MIVYNPSTQAASLCAVSRAPQKRTSVVYAANAAPISVVYAAHAAPCGTPQVEELGLEVPLHYLPALGLRAPNLKQVCRANTSQSQSSS